jgi:hypothetical protein
MLRFLAMGARPEPNLQPRRLLLIGRGVDGVEGAQLEPFRMYQEELARTGIEFRRIDLPTLFTIERSIRAASEDTALIMIGWNEPKEEVLATFERLYQRSDRPRLIFLDYYAQTSTPFFDVLPFVDRYAKRQVLKDRSIYERTDLRGGYIFTDYFSREQNFDLGDWYFGSKLPNEHSEKLVHAWNLGVLARYRSMVTWGGPLLRWNARPIDLHCRLEIGKHSRDNWQWYNAYRTQSREAAEKLAPRYRLTPQGHVRRLRYFLELAHSKLVFSPFGWGEVCIRDFETVAAGALLVKPSMDHVVTSPDIYRAFETYVPVKWDLSDLVEKCTYYLEHPNEARRIADRAREVLREYYERGGFVRDLLRVID